MYCLVIDYLITWVYIINSTPTKPGVLCFNFQLKSSTWTWRTRRKPYKQINVDLLVSPATLPLVDISSAFTPSSFYQHILNEQQIHSRSLPTSRSLGAVPVGPLRLEERWPNAKMDWSVSLISQMSFALWEEKMGQVILIGEGFTCGDLPHPTLVSYLCWFTGVLILCRPDVEPVVNIAPIRSHTRTPSSMWRMMRMTKGVLAWSTALSGKCKLL